MPYLQVADRFYICQDDDATKELQLRSQVCFRTDSVKCFSCHDDFGPANAASIIEFVRLVDSKFSKNPSKSIVYLVESGNRAFTCAFFLVGCYLILKKNADPQGLWNSVSHLPSNLFEFYKDSSSSTTEFRLSVLDCWKGLLRAISHGWFGLQNNDNIWGKIDPIEYSHYDDPLNANLHVVVPGRFLAFQGPRDLDESREYADNIVTGHRYFSPSYYLDIFKELQVRAVVRLNEPQYDPRIYEAAGFRHFDLPFPDCTAPPPAVVRHFFRFIDAHPGLVAVHCKAGLGRTGTLIALYLMRSCGFSAREAMGWLRIMRPGSVIGEQQHFLVQVERAVRSKLSDLTPDTLPGRCPARGSSAADAACSAAVESNSFVTADAGGDRAARWARPIGVAGLSSKAQGPAYLPSSSLPTAAAAGHAKPLAGDELARAPVSDPPGPAAAAWPPRRAPAAPRPVVSFREVVPLATVGSSSPHAAAYARARSSPEPRRPAPPSPSQQSSPSSSSSASSASAAGIRRDAPLAGGGGGTRRDGSPDRLRSAPLAFRRYAAPLTPPG